ncbi:hypothetical protein ymoll0001_28780 [Yersinia mollaretii ATCC 43969]|uniref:Uncharacterized protein n=1 Tax=Yersinia mollaretii (strain ATCC 43969 / DSM 18520 / CIP 103324 / CNY 7263 / WAIP 204) TaxID=349967 RepID=A0ABM9YBA4_YERMW|nr:hypothetical protein ymoll0001_28780 [Yersinia mollaretii ATCC 43969]
MIRGNNKAHFCYLSMMLFFAFMDADQFYLSSILLSPWFFLICLT